MSTVAHTGEARFLQRLALAASSTLDARDLVRLVISETTDAMDVDVCSVYLMEPDGESLLMTATNGLSQAGVGRVSLRLGEGITGWAAEERRPIVVPDVRAEPRFRWLPGVDQARFVSMCSVPILSGDRLVGILNVQSDERRDFTPGDVALLAAIAAHVAGALERSELQGRLEARVAELRRSDEVHRRLSALALAEAGLDAICAAIARTAGAGVAAYDTDGERLASGAPDGLPERLSGFADPERRGDDLTVLPLRAGAERLGWLAAGPADEEIAPGRRAALDHGATVLSLELMRARAEAETERRLRGDLVEELLGTPLSPHDAERLAERAARLGYRIRGPVWVLVLEPDDEDSARALAASTSRRRLARALADEIARLSPGGLAVERGAGMVLLVPGEPGAAEVERLARAAVGAAGALAGGAKASCGISSGPRRPGRPAPAVRGGPRRAGGGPPRRPRGRGGRLRPARRGAAAARAPPGAPGRVRGRVARAAAPPRPGLGGRGAPGGHARGAGGRGLEPAPGGPPPPRPREHAPVPHAPGRGGHRPLAGRPGRAPRPRAGAPRPGLHRRGRRAAGAPGRALGGRVAARAVHGRPSSLSSRAASRTDVP